MLGRRLAFMAPGAACARRFRDSGQFLPAVQCLLQWGRRRRPGLRRRCFLNQPCRTLRRTTSRGWT